MTWTQVFDALTAIEPEFMALLDAEAPALAAPARAAWNTVVQLVTMKTVNDAQQVKDIDAAADAALDAKFPK